MNELQDNSELQDLYRELILDHARKPRNFGRLDNATHTAEGINPLCGDKLRLYLIVDADEQVIDAGFEGSGCAISVASASLLTDAVAGMSTADAINLQQAMTSRLTGSDEDTPDRDLGKLEIPPGGDPN